MNLTVTWALNLSRDGLRGPMELILIMNWHLELCLLRSWMALVEAEWQANGYTVSTLSFNMHPSFSERKDPISFKLNN